MVAPVSEIHVESLIPFFQKWRIVEASLFDDPYRGPLPEELNLLVVFDEEARWSLFDLVQMESELSEITGTTAHIATRRGYYDSAREGVRERAFQSAQLIYEKR
jgi:predicted nucleotidyltransferase